MSISGGFIGEFDENENFYKGKYYKGDFNLLYKKICFERDKLQELYIEDIENNGTLIFEGEFKDGLFYKGKEYGRKLIFEGEYKKGKYWNVKDIKIIFISMNLS